MIEHRRAIALIETVMAIVLVGLLLVVSLRSMSFATRSAKRQSEALEADRLAESLAFEMLAKKFSESPTTSTLGPDNGELARLAFDDFDDYNGLILNPIRDREGTAMPEYSGWSGTISVRAVHADTLMEITPSSDARLKLAELKFQGPDGETYSYHVARGQGYLPPAISPTFDEVATAVRLEFDLGDEVHSRFVPVYTHPVIAED